jgi:DNA-binding transcriptional regulator YhcF (GntR family)
MNQSFDEQIMEVVDEHRELGMSVEEMAEWLRSVIRELEDEFE